MSTATDSQPNKLFLHERKGKNFEKEKGPNLVLPGWGWLSESERQEEERVEGDIAKEKKNS